MTQGERLVRNLCEQRAKELDQELDDHRTAEKTPVPISQLPRTVRDALTVLSAHRRRVQDAEKIIRAAGFEVPDLEDDPKPAELHRPYRYNRDSASSKQLQRTHERRLSRLRKLQHEAVVQTLSVRGEALQKLLLGLQKALEAL